MHGLSSLKCIIDVECLDWVLGLLGVLLGVFSGRFIASGKNILSHSLGCILVLLFVVNHVEL